MDPVIELHGLSRNFGSLVAVNDVSLQVDRGAIFGLLGPNGSGKSTIIRMLLGILPASRGRASVLGFDAQAESELVKPRVGYMSQQFSLYGDLTVGENLDFYGRIYGLRGNRLAERRAAVMELAGIADRRQQLARTLSGGWKQRLALSCSLIHEPDVIFLDEPTAGIDPVARRDLWDLLFKLSSRGVTMLVTTHYMDEAERCTDVGYIYLSRLLVVGKPDQLKRLPDVTPPGTVRYDLAAPRPTNLLAPLRTIPAVRDVTLFGERIHLLVDRELSPDELLARIPVSSPDAKINVVAPSLEDVFVTLTRMADRVGVEQLIAERGMSRAEPSRGAARSEETPDPSPGHSRSAVSAQLGERRSRGKLRHHGDLAGFFAILRKEFVHIRRQPTTLFFMLLVPVLQTIIFGYAINTRIENIPSAVLNFDGRRASELLIEAFRNSRAFDLASDVHDEAALNAELQSGRAQVGIVIPPDFSDRLLRGEQATLQVLVDGSDSQVATAAQHSTALIGQAVSIQLARAKAESLQLAAARDWEGKAVLPIDVRTRLLYNPDLDSSHFFVPGLVGVVLQLVTLFLTSFAIVRERELGTLEQLFVTPVGRSGLMFGKLVPYAIVGFVEVVLMLTVMIYVFRVDIAGNVGLLLGLSLLFTVCSLGLGLFVSTVARTQLEGFQVAFVLMLPSILLSGFVFPRGEMPTPIYWLTFVLPATYFIEILRGIILRGAPAQDLLVPIVGLSCCCVVVLAAAIARFQKRLA